MRWIRTRADVKGHRAPGLETGSPASDDFSFEIWDHLANAIEAAGRGDLDGHRNALLALERDFPASPVAGRYLWFLLRLVVRHSLGRMPNRADVGDLVRQIHPLTGRVVTADQATLEAVLLTVFELPTQSKISGGPAVVLGSAIVGAVAQPSEDDLVKLRGHVETWYARHMQARLSM